MAWKIPNMIIRVAANTANPTAHGETSRAARRPVSDISYPFHGDRLRGPATLHLLV
jgi:hypothetical protein